MSDLTARQRLTAYLQQSGLSTARAKANLAAFEREIRERVARDLLAVDPVDWALAGQHAGKDAAAIARGINQPAAEETPR